MKRIKKAVIPAAGLGTRFLPATKEIPKEMLPIVDKPAIQYIVEEIASSGIEEIIIVTSRNKGAIEDHFDKNEALEFSLRKQNKQVLVSIVEEVSHLADIHYVRQKQPLGLGHAISAAKNLVGNEPFAVLLGDMIIDSVVPSLKQLLDVYEEVQSSIIAIAEVDGSDIHKYGVVDVEAVREGLYKVNQLVEKPKENPPSNLAIIGRYILEPEIFAVLENTSVGVGEEIQLTDALQNFVSRQTLYAFKTKGRVYDVGNKFGYLQALVELGSKKDEAFKQFIKEFVTRKERGDSN